MASQLESLGVEGPFNFTAAEVDAKVLPHRVGSYVLGIMEDKRFKVSYVGRSDSDLNAELKKGLPLGYSQFMFSYARSREDAFMKEAKNYHFFGGRKLDNKRHPERPNGVVNLECPVEGCTELR